MVTAPVHNLVTGKGISGHRQVHNLVTQVEVVAAPVQNLVTGSGRNGHCPSSQSSNTDRSGHRPSTQSSLYTRCKNMSVPVDYWFMPLLFTLC